MDTYNTDTFDIDLWYYLQLLFRHKYYIIALVIIGLISSYFVSSFVIQKEYQSEMWIQLNSNFLYAKEEIPLEYIQIYLNYPEVISATMLGEHYDLMNYKDRLSVQKTNNIVQIAFRYHDKNEVDQLLKKWVSTMQLKLILDAGDTRLSILQDDKAALQVNLHLMENKYKNIKELLDQEGQYTAIEVVSKESKDLTPFVFKELNPNYIDLNEQANNLQIEIGELTDRYLLLEQIEKEYKEVLDEVSQFFSSENLVIDDILTKLNLLQTKYSAYYINKVESSNCALIPFQVISESNTKADSVYPNVLLNTVIAGLIGLCISVFLVVFIDYIKSSIQDDKECSI